ncbi:MAG TPA: hypothetical protein VGM92_08595 [Candidatus Kapabacteria bacterium]
MKIRTCFAASAAMLSMLVAVAGCVINFKDPNAQRILIHADAAYRYPGRCEFNSNGKYYKKEIQKGHFAETKDIELDPGQQLLVLNKAIVLNFYQMPDTFYHKGSGPRQQSQFIRIWADTLDKRVYWNGSLDSLQPHKYHLKELVEYVDSIVKSTDEYRNLPKSDVTGD